MSFTKAFRESTTLKACIVASIAILIKLIIGPYDFGFGSGDDVSVGEFGVAFAAIWAVWRHSEWQRAQGK